MVRSFTALAFPPTCIHLSWNQFQLESNSVDLCARAACHPPADTRRHFPGRLTPVIWQVPRNINQPPPDFLNHSLSVKALLFSLIVKRALIIFQIRGRLNSQALKLGFGFLLEDGQSHFRRTRQSVSNDKVNAANFSPNLTFRESSLTARKEGSLTQTRKRTVWEGVTQAIPSRGRLPDPGREVSEHRFQDSPSGHSALLSTQPWPGRNTAAIRRPHLMKLRWTPRERCTPEQSMHKKTPYVMLAQLGFLAPQSKQAWMEEARSE